MNSIKVMSGVTKKTSKVKKTNENEGSGAAESVTKRKRNRKYLTTTNKTHLKALTTFFVTTTFLLHHATAEKYIGMNHYCYLGCLPLWLWPLVLKCVYICKKKKKIKRFKSLSLCRTVFTRSVPIGRGCFRRRYGYPTPRIYSQDLFVLCLPTE